MSWPISSLPPFFTYLPSLYYMIIYPDYTGIMPGLEGDDLKFHEGFLLVQAFQFCCSLKRLNPLAETWWWYFMTNGDTLQRNCLLSAGSIFHPAKAEKQIRSTTFSCFNLRFTYHLTQTSKNSRIFSSAAHALEDEKTIAARTTNLALRTCEDGSFSSASEISRTSSRGSFIRGVLILLGG